MTTTLLLVGIGLLLLVHLGLLAYAFHRASGRTQRVESSGQNRTHTSDGITCPDCSTANSPEYKYCRRCVTELPTGVSFTRNTGGERTRRTR